MSECQYLAFRAIDAPVSAKNLQFMEEQSTRAEITPWSFTNEYHFGDFSGDAMEMLRRGYDFHFHYSNFGDRKIAMRLPDGLPNPKAAKDYLGKEFLQFEKDKSGGGGILCFDPFYEAGTLDDLWDMEDALKDLLPLRAEILDGGLRPLYLAYLAVARDVNHDAAEIKDAPVPAGLDKLTPAQRKLAKLYGLHKSLITAAARGAPHLPKRPDSSPNYAQWLQTQPDAAKIAWLSELMDDPKSSVRSKILTEYRKSRPIHPWPTIRMDRTVADIMEMAGEGQEED